MTEFSLVYIKLIAKKPLVIDIISDAIIAALLYKLNRNKISLRKIKLLLMCAAYIYCKFFVYILLIYIAAYIYIAYLPLFLKSDCGIFPT